MSSSQQHDTHDEIGVELDKIIDRVRRLLKQAEGTNNEHEAATFMAKAHELMIKHAIDQSALSDADQSKDRIISERIDVPGRQTGVKARRMLLIAVAGIAKCKLIKYGPQSSSHYEITGYEGDVAYCRALYASLLTQMQTALRLDHASSTTAKNNFMWGYVDRVASRLVAATVRKEQEAIATSSSTALVLRDRFADVERFVAAKHPKLRKAGWGKMGQYDPTARQRGAAAGEQANLGAGPAVRQRVRGELN